MDTYSGVPFVPARFNDRPYHFVVDTGCGNSIFGRELFPLLTKTERRAVSVWADRTVREPLYRAPQGTIGSLNLPSLSTVSLMGDQVARPIPWRVHGFLGMDALKDLIVRLDYDRGRISFLRAVPRDAGTSVRMDTQGRHDCPVIRATVAGREYRFILDTGCLSYWAGGLMKRDFDSLLAEGRLSLVQTPSLWSGTGTAVARMAVATTPVSVGPYKHSALVFSEMPNPGLTEGTFGLGYLRRYVVTFDFPNHVVYLAPGRQFRQIDASHDPGGIRLRRDADAVRVSYVAGEAIAAGVQAGDVLEAVNGVKAKGLDDVALAGLLSTSDHPTAVTVRRPGGGSRVTCVYDVGEAVRRTLEHFQEAK